MNAQQKCTVAALLFSAIIIPQNSVEARHNDFRRQSDDSYSREISRLDDDIVEDFFIPVLFGLRLQNITPDFGDPRDNGNRSHEGQDMVATLGTPIVTPTDAVVTRVGTGESAGKYVYTRNPGGESFRYMHLDEFADIKAGDVLEAGDFIGTVGDTGNAQGVFAHLHFEIREQDAIDPYPRLTKELSLEEKMELVERMFEDLDDSDEMAEFLTSTYTTDFKNALNAGYDLPREISDALNDMGIVSVASLLEQLEKIINSIPSLVTDELTLGSQGTSVGLLQTYLIYNEEGPAVTALKSAGATGYFGSITQAALVEYQAAMDIPQTGNYDRTTRAELIAENE